MKYDPLTPFGGAVMMTALLIGAVSGKWLIPLFRFFKTGMYEPRIGDRFRNDGTSPRFGGAVIMAGLLAGAVLAEFALAKGGVHTAPLTLALLYILLAFACGFLQDYVKQKLRRPAGIKARYEFLYLFGISLFFLLTLKAAGVAQTAVLLPFRLGFAELGALYYPIMALLMTILIYAFCVHDTFGGQEKNCIGGLMSVTTVILSLFYAVMGGGCASFLGYALAGAAAGLMVWELSPSKIYHGQSGQLLCGAAVCSMAILTNRDMLLIILPISVIMEFMAAGVRYIYYIKTKRVLLLGGSLHSHLKEKGVADMWVILIFLPFTLIGVIAGVMFMLYSAALM